MAVSAISRSVAPPSEAVVWVWQSPRIAAITSPPSRIGTRLRSSRLARYPSVSSLSASSITVAVDLPMPASSVSVPAAARWLISVAPTCCTTSIAFWNARTFCAGASSRSR